MEIQGGEVAAVAFEAQVAVEVPVEEAIVAVVVVYSNSEEISNSEESSRSSAWLHLRQGWR